MKSTEKEIIAICKKKIKNVMVRMDKPFVQLWPIFTL